MKKLLLGFLLIFINSFLYSQFDTEHWFAPFANQNNQSTEQYLYLSTNTSSPFNVDIYNNNQLLQKVQISKGNPAVIPIDSGLMSTYPNDDTFLNKVTKKGLHLVGEKKFFAHYRFSLPNHAEIITSKGKAGAGNRFYVVTPKNQVQNNITNSTFGIIATENQTNIKISGYDPNIVFFGLASTPSEINVTLNKGESYIVSLKSSDAIKNKDGFSGTYIESDKSISITNGNINGMYSPTTPNNNSDALIDQAIPIDRLGKEFIVMSGFGSISPNNNMMEEVIVLATEDNTNIYLNGSSTPFNAVPLKKGEYEIINDTPSEGVHYQQKNGDAYTMYVKTNNNAYVYQLLAGVPNSYATGGYNIVPPLICLLPNKIEEFSLIDEIGYNKFNVKMNIIAEKGAKVSMNGTPISSSFGPYTVDGTNLWETYSVPNVSGNITISADKAITAGIAAGNGAVGYGGYFAGFNSNPIISKGGDCDKGNITLEVDDTYDSYQWYFNGTPYTGSGANTYIISPTESGDYYVKIVKTNCGTQDSPIYSYQRCPFKTTNSIEISNCNPTFITPIPKFSTFTQNVNVSSVKIWTQPSNGTVTINNLTGEITYTLTNFSATIDSFTYYFSGTDPKFPDTEYVTVNIKINHLKTITGEAFACIKPDKTGDFDLTQAKVSNDTNITNVEYYENYDPTTKTFSNLISNFNSYNSIPKTIYAKVTNSYGCTDVAEINLKFYPIPNIDTLKFDSILCDSDFDGLYEPDFDEISKTIVSNSADFDIYFFDNAGLNFPALPKDWTYTTLTRVYVLVASRNGCTNATGFIDFKIGNKISINPYTTQVCDGDFSNSETLNLASYLPQLTSETGYTYQFYATQNDANLEQNPIPDSQNISANATFFVRIKKSGICDNIASLTLNFGQPSTSTTLPAAVTVCEGSTTTLDAGTGFTSYLWSNGATTQTITVGKGDYSVVLTSNNTCTYTQKVSVVESPKAIVDISKFNTIICDDNLDGTIEINLNNVTSAILINPGIYRVKYYLNATDANAGNANFLNSDWSFSADTTIFARVESDFCPAQIYPLDFKFGNKVTLLASSISQEVCDDNLDGTKAVNLKDSDSFFTTDASVIIKYFNSESDAKNNRNPINSSLTVTNSGTYFLRFEKANSCANWAQLTINVKIPKASSTLKDVQICKNANTLLDAGTGFSAYLWSNGDTTQTTSLGIGNHYVDLTFNGCTYRQLVNVTAAEDPLIESITVNENTITINVTGGTLPYSYSIDGINYQSSNVFTNLRRGLQTAYVKGAELCTPVEKQFLVLNLINAITPNGDGINDVLDYSDLRIKKDVKILVFDRYGSQIYSSQNTNSFVWNGKSSYNRAIATGTYWYVLEWIEPDTNIKMNYKGWILVKNRN
ncbi:hypothetical protein GCM10010992_08890 [Cloacibacterium rupense]|uniref:IgGFc-binding protein N-terminal domain-containing protein n=1 Tax=Cloacibacterium rupense TaxID=517423 RepID=A0ABQ2NMJ2_9FLAO|nr:gliding motility-associated C-terminal domain-containing protein [Cloacibacterium rupense]GGP02848.1 hypothetical protein GCM10010992_08890 [Cloacibacterium rupense]